MINLNACFFKKKHMLKTTQSGLLSSNLFNLIYILYIKADLVVSILELHFQLDEQCW